MPVQQHIQNPSLTYPAVYVIFTLLNAIRRGIERKNIWREFRRQKVALHPCLAFWLAVCKQAGLVDEYQGKLRVKGYTRRWLNKTTEEQTFHLIESWQLASKNRKARQFRKKLLWKLKYDQPLTEKDRGALNGLEALGLVSNGLLTRWGGFFIKGEGELPTPAPVEPCHIEQEQFTACLPQHTDLLWDLETYLRPSAPGQYSLTREALRYSSGDSQEWIPLLERGLGTQLPGLIRARLLNQPSLRMRKGILLEFSDPEELSALRRQPIFRKYLDQVLSPRHVLLPEKEISRFTKMLGRRGVHLILHEETEPPEKKRTHFAKASLLAPVGKSVPKLELIEKYQHLQQGLDLLYHAPGCNPEKRRITPLQVEQRGGQTYIIAWCHASRRTPNAMEIAGTY
jgi:hypothetical protein